MGKLLCKERCHIYTDMHHLTILFYVPYLEAVLVVNRDQVLSKWKQTDDTPLVAGIGSDFFASCEGVDHTAILKMQTQAFPEGPNTAAVQGVEILCIGKSLPVPPPCFLFVPAARDFASKKKFCSERSSRPPEA